MFWRKLAVLWSTAGLFCCLAEAVLSFVPAVQAPPGLAIGLAIGMFPVFGAAVIGLAVQRRSAAVDGSKSTGRGLLSPLPFPVPWWIGLIFALAGVCFVSAMSGLPGQPEVIHGSYFFVDHGSLIPTSVARYRAGLRAEDRIFSGVPAVFYAFSYAIHRQLGWPADETVPTQEPPPPLSLPNYADHSGPDRPSSAQLATRFATVERENDRLRKSLRTTASPEGPPQSGRLDVPDGS